MQPLPAPENKRHYPGLDGLRALAVLAVFAQHYFVYPAAYRWGWIGVRIFFVLSGFLITGILYDTQNDPHRVRRFYARRTLRIFPLYYGVLLLGWMLWPIFRWAWHPVWLLAPLYLENFGRFLWFADFQQNPALLDHLLSTRHFAYPFRIYYGHFWSLCIEEQFYMVWPLLVFWIRDRKRLMMLCAAMVVLLPACRFICAITLPAPVLEAAFAERFTPLQADSLLLGAFFALWMRGRHPNFTQIGRGLVVGLFVLFLGLDSAHYVLHGTLYAPTVSGALFTSLGYTGINLFGAGLVLWAIDGESLFSRALDLRPLTWLGTVSYGFYVFHDIPHLAYDRLANAFPGAHSNDYGLLSGALALAGTLALSWLSFRYFESGFLRLKSRF